MLSAVLASKSATLVWTDFNFARALSKSIWGVGKTWVSEAHSHDAVVRNARAFVSSFFADMETPTETGNQWPVAVEEAEQVESVSDEDSTKPTNDPTTFDLTAEVEQMMKKVMRDILSSGNSDTSDFGKIAFTSVDAEPSISVWVYPGIMKCLWSELLIFSVLKWSELPSWSDEKLR